MERTLAGLERLAGQRRAAGRARAREDAGGLEALLDAGAVRVQDPRGLRRLPRAHRRDLRFADARDVERRLHTDGLHETAELEDTVAAIAGRTVHAYHVEGTGGGHVPDLLGLVREPNIICSSTTPTIPCGRQRRGRGPPDDRPEPRRRRSAWPSDVELVRERVHPATMAAEGPLHELGAIAIVNSDSQGMGRIMETVRRTFQLAHAMKAWRGDRGRGGPSRAAADARRRPTTRPRPALPRQGDDRAGDHARHRRPRRVARIRDGSPTSCSGSRRTSASSRSSCSRAGIRPGRRSARATPRSSGPSRRATARTGAGRACGAPRSRVTFVSAPGAADRAPARWTPAAGGRRRSADARGLTRADLVHESRDRPDRGRPCRRPGHPRRPAARGGARDRGPAQPPLLGCVERGDHARTSGRGLCCWPRAPGPAQRSRHDGGGSTMRTRLLIMAAVIAAVAAACSSTGGGSAGASSPSAASSSASGLTGKAWQLTAITTKVPAFQGVIPAPTRRSTRSSSSRTGRSRPRPTATRSPGPTRPRRPAA